MKRGIIAAAIIAAVALTAILTNKALTESAERLEQAALQATRSKSGIELLTEEWGNCKPLFELFTHHEYFEEIDFIISTLPMIDSEKYSDLCAELSLHFGALRERISFSFGNLF